jgi:phage shock protein E
MINLIEKIFRGNKTDFKTLVQNGAVIIDVRSDAEFRSGHIKDAVNIPVEQVKNKIHDLKKMNKPVITCCKSGFRSGTAASVLASAGVEVYNGGAWNLLQGKPENF